MMFILNDIIDFVLTVAFIAVGWHLRGRAGR